MFASFKTIFLLCVLAHGRWEVFVLSKETSLDIPELRTGLTVEVAALIKDELLSTGNSTVTTSTDLGRQLQVRATTTCATWMSRFLVLPCIKNGLRAAGLTLLGQVVPYTFWQSVIQMPIPFVCGRSHWVKCALSSFLSYERAAMACADDWAFWFFTGTKYSTTYYLRADNLLGLAAITQPSFCTLRNANQYVNPFKVDFPTKTYQLSLALIVGRNLCTSSISPSVARCKQIARQIAAENRNQIHLAAKPHCALQLRCTLDAYNSVNVWLPNPTTSEGNCAMVEMAARRCSEKSMNCVARAEVIQQTRRLADTLLPEIHGLNDVLCQQVLARHLGAQCPHSCSKVRAVLDPLLSTRWPTRHPTSPPTFPTPYPTFVPTPRPTPKPSLSTTRPSREPTLPPSTVGPSTSRPTAPPGVVSSIRFPSRFSRVVHESDEFKQYIVNVIASTLAVAPSEIRILSIESGSVIVFFTVASKPVTEEMKVIMMSNVCQNDVWLLCDVDPTPTEKPVEDDVWVWLLPLLIVIGVLLVVVLSIVGFKAWKKRNAQSGKDFRASGPKSQGGSTPGDELSKKEPDHEQTKQYGPEGGSRNEITKG